MLQNVKERIEPAAANDHNSPLRSQQLQVVPEVHIGKHLKNEVHTPPAGGFQYLFPVVRVGVIEDVSPHASPAPGLFEYRRDWQPDRSYVTA